MELLQYKPNINEPTISIIVPMYNEERHIEACLKSIINLNYPKDKIELIVVDDGSQDNTVSIAAKFDPLILKTHHLGCANARNIGVSNANGEIIAFLDADDLCKDNWIKEIVPYFDDEKVGAIGCSHDLLNTPKSDIIQISFKEKCFRHMLSPCRTDHIGASGCLVRKNVFLNVGGFTSSLRAAEDSDLSNKIREINFDIILIKEPLISVTYPNKLSQYFLNQIRNSSYHTIFILNRIKRVTGNKYSGMLDYIQSILPSIFICSMVLSPGKLNILVALILLLFLINIHFFRYLLNSKKELSNFWPINAMIYLTVRSIAWNIGLFNGIFLYLCKTIRS